MTTDPMVHSWHVLGMIEGLYTFCPLFTACGESASGMTTVS